MAPPRNWASLAVMGCLIHGSPKLNLKKDDQMFLVASRSMRT
jgi:hypothetical protein